jgi:DNA-binding NtrC family response regulator
MRILVIENDSELRTFFGTKLKDEFKGTIDLVSTVKEAINLLKTERPYDVIVSDFDLPNGSGFDLLHFKVKNGISGAFIFFGTVKGGIPYLSRNYQQVEKFSFGHLCQEIKRAYCLRHSGVS